MSSLLVVGSVAFDTLHISGKTYSKVLGGSAMYASIAASYFSNAQLVGIVGDDFPTDVLANLGKRGIDLSGLEKVKGKTFHWEGQYNRDFSSRTTLRTDLNVFADFQPKIPETFRETPYVMLGNIQPELQHQVLDQIATPRLVIADTMNLWIEISRPELSRLLKRINILIINDEEARQLSGDQNLVCAAKSLQRQGPYTVIIKKGEHGAMLFWGDSIFSLPAMPLTNVTDPTGAGDTFAGAFIGYLASIDQIVEPVLRKAVVYGSVLSSFCVEGVGTTRIESTSKEDIIQRFIQLQELVEFPKDMDYI